MNIVPEGATRSLPVSLSTQPTGNVTVSVSSNDTTALTVSPSSRTFSTSNWGSSQIFTLTGPQDADEVNENVTLTFTATGADYGGVTRTWAVTIHDDDYSFVFEGRSTDIDEGTTESYKVKLSRRPPGNRTVTTVSGNSDVLEVIAGASLTFTTSNWGTGQTVQLRANQDSDPLDHGVNVTTSASSFDTDTHLFSIADDDERRIVFTLPATVTEGGNTAGSVRLGTLPTGTVTVTPESDDTGSLVVNQANYTFTTSNWSTLQQLTATAQEDNDIGDENVTITLSASGADYADIEASRTITVEDDEVASVTFSSSPSTVLEGNTGTFSLSLDYRPTGSVTISASSDAQMVLTVSPANRTFTTSNYDTDQDFTITGVMDSSEAAIVTFDGAGGGYGDIDIEKSVTVHDVELTFSSSPSTVTEGLDATFSFKLSSQPTGSVTISVTEENSAGDYVDIDPASVTFTTTNWNTDQDVTVTGNAVDSDTNTTVNFAGSGGGFGAIDVDKTISVTNAGLVFSASPTTVDEDGSTTFSFKLAVQPSDDTIISITSDDTGALTVDPATVTFTTANWNTDQSITASGVEDGDLDDETVTLTFAGPDDAFSVDKTIAVVDQGRKFTQTRTFPTTIMEGSSISSYGVLPNWYPTTEGGSIRLSRSSNNAAVVITNALLIWDADNWETFQYFTFTAPQDTNSVNEEVEISYTLSERDADDNLSLIHISEPTRPY